MYYQLTLITLHFYLRHNTEQHNTPHTHTRDTDILAQELRIGIERVYREKKKMICPS